MDVLQRRLRQVAKVHRPLRPSLRLLLELEGGLGICQLEKKLLLSLQEQQLPRASQEELQLVEVELMVTPTQRFYSSHLESRSFLRQKIELQMESMLPPRFPSSLFRPAHPVQITLFFMCSKNLNNIYTNDLQELISVYN